MTNLNKASLQALFETGDIPTGPNYSDFIDSCVNLAETSAQSMSGPLNPTELITPRVSANNGVFTGTLRVDGLMSAANITMFGILSANAINASTSITTSAATIFGSVSAASIWSTNGVIGSVGVVSAAGTSQGTAASLANVVNRGKGIVDGTTTGFTPLTGRPGFVQYLFNEGVSANLWPPTGGTINGLAVNAAFSLATSAMVTIVHLTASAYAVK